MINNDSVEEFDFDLRRTLILSKYLAEWGVPKSRMRISMRNASPLEVYFFPGGENKNISRFATIGASAQKKASGDSFCHELLFVLPVDLGGAGEREVFDYLLDISVYALGKGVNFGVGEVVPESPLAPQGWKLRAILIDEARGESKLFGEMHVGIQHVELLWLIPIYGNEYFQIKNCGISSFDYYCDQSEYSLVDINRPSVVPVAPFTVRRD